MLHRDAVVDQQGVRTHLMSQLDHFSFPGMKNAARRCLDHRRVLEWDDFHPMAQRTVDSSADGQAGCLLHDFPPYGRRDEDTAKEFGKEFEIG